MDILDTKKGYTKFNKDGSAEFIDNVKIIKSIMDLAIEYAEETLCRGDSEVYGKMNRVEMIEDFNKYCGVVLDAKDTR